jgi:hypothetical protein
VAPVAAPPSPAATSHSLADYDAFVVASATNSPADADVYAIRFDPFSVDRITTDKRISSMGADDEHVMVAAGDEQIDKLAQVTGSGDLKSIPGLGRPHAFTPYLAGGVLYYRDVDDRGHNDQYRFLSWDLKKETGTLLYQSEENFGAAKPMTGGRMLLVTDDEEGNDQVAIRSKSGKLTEFPLHGVVSLVRAGRSWIATTLVGAGDQGGNQPEATVLVDPTTGRTKRIPGLQAICWNPAGTLLLARRTADLTNSQLVLLDPAHPDAPRRLQTVPGLAIFNGTWVRGGPAID